MKSDLQKTKDRKEKQTKIDRKKENRNIKKSRLDEAKGVANMFNTLKKGCDNDKELKDRILALKERLPNAFKIFKRKEDMKHNKKMIEIAKDLDDKTLEKIEKMKALDSKQVQIDMVK